MNVYIWSGNVREIPDPYDSVVSTSNYHFHFIVFPVFYVADSAWMRFHSVQLAALIGIPYFHFTILCARYCFICNWNQGDDGSGMSLCLITSVVPNNTPHTVVEFPCFDCLVITKSRRQQVEDFDFQYIETKFYELILYLAVINISLLTHIFLTWAWCL